MELGKHHLLKYNSQEYLAGVAARFTREGLDRNALVRLLVGESCFNSVLKSLVSWGFNVKTLLDSGRVQLISNVGYGLIFVSAQERARRLRDLRQKFVALGFSRVFSLGDVPSVRGTQKQTDPHTPEEFEEEMLKFEEKVNDLPYRGLMTGVCAYNTSLHPQPILSRLEQAHEVQLM